MSENEKAYRIWQRIDLLRNERSLIDISDASGIKYQRIKEQRSSNRIPSAFDLYQLASALGTTMEYLLTGESSVSAYSPRIKAIADACTRASDLELAMIEKILSLPVEGENTLLSKEKQA